MLINSLNGTFLPSRLVAAPFSDGAKGKRTRHANNPYIDDNVAWANGRPQGATRLARDTRAAPLFAPEASRGACSVKHPGNLTRGPKKSHTGKRLRGNQK